MHGKIKQDAIQYIICSYVWICFFLYSYSCFWNTVAQALPWTVLRDNSRITLIADTSVDDILEIIHHFIFYPGGL